MMQDSELDRLFEAARSEWRVWRAGHPSIDVDGLSMAEAERLDEADYAETNRITEPLVHALGKPALLALAADDRVWSHCGALDVDGGDTVGDLILRAVTSLIWEQLYLLDRQTERVVRVPVDLSAWRATAGA